MTSIHPTSASASTATSTEQSSNMMSSHRVVARVSPSDTINTIKTIEPNASLTTLPSLASHSQIGATASSFKNNGNNSNTNTNGEIDNIDIDAEIESIQHFIIAGMDPSFDVIDGATNKAVFASQDEEDDDSDHDGNSSDSDDDDDDDDGKDDDCGNGGDDSDGGESDDDDTATNGSLSLTDLNSPQQPSRKAPTPSNNNNRKSSTLIESKSSSSSHHAVGRNRSSGQHHTLSSKTPPRSNNNYNNHHNNHHHHPTTTANSSNQPPTIRASTPTPSHKKYPPQKMLGGGNDRSHATNINITIGNTNKHQHQHHHNVHGGLPSSIADRVHDYNTTNPSSSSNINNNTNTRNGNHNHNHNKANNNHNHNDENDNDNDNDDGTIMVPLLPTLPTPPNHFTCPISQTLFIDPVIDREGHTYERDAILRWLVLTNNTFGASIMYSSDSGSSGHDDNGGLEQSGSSGSNEESSSSSNLNDCLTSGELLKGSNSNNSSGEQGLVSGGSLALLGHGTSPITGNYMSVAELVEDKVVKSAIERWRKECWVRFLLGNKTSSSLGNMDNGCVDNSGDNMLLDASTKSAGCGGGGGVLLSEQSNSIGNGIPVMEGTSISGMMMDVSERSARSQPSSSKSTTTHKSFTQESTSPPIKSAAAKSVSKSMTHGSLKKKDGVAGSGGGLTLALTDLGKLDKKKKSSGKSGSSSSSSKHRLATTSSSSTSHKSTASQKSAGSQQHKSTSKSGIKGGSGGSGKHMEFKAPSTTTTVANREGNTIPPLPQDAPARIISPSPTKEVSSSSSLSQDRKSISKQHPPPPPPPPKQQQQQQQHTKSSSKSSERKKASRSRGSKSGGSKSRSSKSGGRSKHGHGMSSISSSQKTAITSNTTPTTLSKGKATPGNTHTTNNNALLPPPPLFTSPGSCSVTTTSVTTHDNTASAAAGGGGGIGGPPIKDIIQQPNHKISSHSSGSSFCSNLSNPYDLLSMAGGPSTQPLPQYNGWSVPLGVHKVICATPGLRVTSGVHRRSLAVKIPNGGVDINGRRVDRELIISPGSYVEILETQVHGERVRGRICWEGEVDDNDSPLKEKNKKTLKTRTSRLLKRTSRKNNKKRKKSGERPKKLVSYEGWISVQWAKSEEEKEVENNDDELLLNDETTDLKEMNKLKGSIESRVTDEDAGPWTEPVPLGVYRINFGGGLPLRKTPERDSAVLGKLDRGQCVEVVQTQVKGDRVRARVIVPDEDGEASKMKFTSGWISLLNALTGSSGASPVPLGAYVVVAEPGCVITEGGRLDSKVKGNLVPGSCMEVVATRMEEGVVRGLIDGGGHVTLFMPPGKNRSGISSTSDNGRKNADGGRMFAMPVPLGTYQIIQNGLSVTSGISSTSSILMKLQQNATAEIIETRVENGRVRGRICAVVNEDGTRVVGYERSSSSSGSAGEACGWINLFEPNMRWAKIVCFKGGRPVNSGGGGGVAQQTKERRKSARNSAAC